MTASDELEKFVINAQRRKTLFKTANDAALRNIDSGDIPQANELARVFHIVEMIANQKDVTPEALQITPRQFAYYRRAAQILGLLTESDDLTAAGRLIARLGIEDRLRATVVYFESSICGDAWIQWSRGKTLLDINPETAFEFIRKSVPGLNNSTVDRRAQTLIAWHADVSPPIGK